MRSKNISFAQVLKKKTKSPQIEATKGSYRLMDLMQQWQEFPQENYTLYLGNIGLSQRSKPSTIRMFTSKNTNQDQQEMFDSWIQRQSSVGNNKENIGFQPKRNMTNDLLKQQPVHKNIYNSKGKDTNRIIPKSMAEMVRNAQKNNDYGGNQYLTVNPQVQMIKSNVSQNQQRMGGIRSPKNYKEQEAEEYQLQFQEVTKKEPQRKQLNFKNIHQKQGFRNQFNQIPQKQLQVHKQIQANQINNRKKNTKLEDYIASTENIHNEIADIAKEMIKRGKSHESEEQDQELLISDSDKKQMPRVNNYRQLNIDQSLEDDQQFKKRKEEAKNAIQNYCKNKNKGFSLINGPKSTNQFSQLYEQKNTKAVEQPKIQVIPANLQVGYSFSSNIIDDTHHNDEETQLNIDHIPQIKSQMPSQFQKMQQSQDFQFRKKYINIDQIIVPDQHIKNIQSIQYQTQRSHCDEEAKAGDNEPNHSFEAKLISSEGEGCNEDVKPEIVVNIPNNYSKEYYNYPKQTKTEKLQTNNSMNYAFATPYGQHQIQNQQKDYKGRDLAASKQNNYEYKQSQYGYYQNQYGLKENQYQTKPCNYSIEKKEIYQKLSPKPDISDENQEQSKVEQQTKPQTTKVSIQQMESPKTLPHIVEEQPIVQQFSSQTFSKLSDIKQTEHLTSPHKTIKQIKTSILNPSSQSISDILKVKPEQSHSISSVSAYTASPSYAPATYAQTTPSYISTFNKTAANYNIPTTTYQSNYTCNNNASYSNNYGLAITKPYNSPKMYEYERTSTQNIYAPSSFRTYQPYQPSKIQYIAPSVKTEVHTSKAYESKMSSGVHYEYVSEKVQITQKMEKKNYLNQLDIKQSITYEQPVKREPMMVKKQMTKISICKPETTNSFNKTMKQSLKQSINVGESGQFQFDF